MTWQSALFAGIFAAAGFCGAAALMLSAIAETVPDAASTMAVRRKLQREAMTATAAAGLLLGLGAWFGA